MKKFFCVIPMQGKLFEYQYEAMGNARLSWELITPFPVFYPIRGYAVAGEEIGVIAVCVDNADSRRNLERFREELKALCASMEVPYTLNVLYVPETEEALTHVNTFQQLICQVNDNDELFGCMTYGTKPLSEALRMSLQYAYRIKENASIVCVVYGGILRKENVTIYSRIYDMTALIQIDELVRVLAERKIANPEAIVQQLLKG